MTPKPAGIPPRPGLGAGVPCAVAANGYLYVFYVDWGYTTGPDAVHMARAPISSDGAPGTWQKWYNGSFSQPGLGGLSTPVQNPVPPESATFFSCFPDVSFNSYLQQWVMVFQTADGVYYSTSADLTSWTVQGCIVLYDVNAGDPQPGQTWYCYPTLISPDQPTEEETSQSGYLYYSKGVSGVTAHTMYRRAFSFVPAPAGVRLVNISTRALVGAGADILIPGFVIGGSGAERLLIRAVGPGLTQFGVTGVLTQPSLSVIDSAGTTVASNASWGSNTNPNPDQIASIAAHVGAFALAPGSNDSALVVNLGPGSYTVQVSGLGNTTGIALAEIYEEASAGTARLINISTRAQVGTGSEAMIAGFVIAGNGTEQLLLRGDGPALAQFGVTGVLAAPSLSVFNNAGAVIASNTGWGTSSNPSLVSSVATAVGAFPLASGSVDSAQVVSLTHGAYTMQVSGANRTAGVALAEVYEVLSASANSSLALGLPRISVDRSGPAAVFRDPTGKPFIPRGSNYIRLNLAEGGHHSTFEPGQYSPFAVETALATMESLGYNVTRVFIDRGGPGDTGGINGPWSTPGLDPGYMWNLADFLMRATRHHVYTLITMEFIPYNQYYTGLITPSDPNFGGSNTYYLQGAGVRAKQAFVGDLVDAVASYAGASMLSSVFAWELDNEMFYEADTPPFSSTTVSVTTSDGGTYSMSDPAQREAAADNNMVFYANLLADTVHGIDPAALVTIGAFTFQAVGKTGPQGLPIPPTGADERFPARIQVLATSTRLDFVDVHIYPLGSGYSFDSDLQFSEWSGIPSSTPVVMAEFGAFKMFYVTAAQAAQAMTNLQINAWKRGFEGFLYWTFDGDITSEQSQLWDMLDGGDAILNALAPTNRPDPGA